MTENDRNEIINYYRLGYNANEISVMTLYSITQIKKLIGEINVADRREARHNLKSHLNQDVAEGNVNVKQLAEKYGVSINTVYCYCRVGHRHPRQDSKTPLILEDLRRGEKMIEIAKKHNVSRQLVFTIKKKYL